METDVYFLTSELGGLATPNGTSTAASAANSPTRPSVIGALRRSRACTHVLGHAPLLFVRSSIARKPRLRSGVDSLKTPSIVQFQSLARRYPRLFPGSAYDRVVPLRRDAKVELLKKVPLFAGCTKAELRQLARIADEIDLREGTVLTREGRAGHEFCVL